MRLYYAMYVESMNAKRWEKESNEGHYFFALPTQGQVEKCKEFCARSGDVTQLGLLAEVLTLAFSALRRAPSPRIKREKTWRQQRRPSQKEEDDCRDDSELEAPRLNNSAGFNTQGHRSMRWSIHVHDLSLFENIYFFENMYLQPIFECSENTILSMNES